MVMHEMLVGSQGYCRSGFWACSCSLRGLEGPGMAMDARGVGRSPGAQRSRCPALPPPFTLCPWVCYIFCVTRAGIRSSQPGDIAQEKGNFWSQPQEENAWEGEAVGTGVCCPSKFPVCPSPSEAEEDWLCVSGRPSPSLWFCLG